MPVIVKTGPFDITISKHLLVYGVVKLIQMTATHPNENYIRLPRFCDNFENTAKPLS